MEIIANFDNKAFLDAVRDAKEGDVIAEKYGDLTVVKIFMEQGDEYEERMADDVLFRRVFSQTGRGKLLRKMSSKLPIFVPEEVYSR